MNPRHRLTLAAGLFLAAAGCVREARGERSESVDRSIPMAQQIVRFNADLPTVHEFEGGAESKDALVAAMVRALVRSDAQGLASLAITRAEYGQLYFPTSRYATAPYELPPDIAFMLSSAASEKGMARLLERLGGQNLMLRGYRCNDAGAEGENRFWRECTIDLVHPSGERIERRLFHAIIERAGRYKILSYASDF